MSSDLITRSELRSQSADKLNHLTKAQLFDFGVTRVSKLTALDYLRVPVYAAIRPSSKTICITGGKGFTHPMARAGAIAEAIEYWAGETPFGPYITQRWIDLEDPPCPWEHLPLARSSIATGRSALAFSPVKRSHDQKSYWLPSDLIWMTQRQYTPFVFFQMGSNGLAVGATHQDACVTGLYELIERDAWTLAQTAFYYFRILPARVDLEDYFPELQRRIKEAGLELYLFDTTTDVGIPCYWAMLSDPTNWIGTFAGHGCSLSGKEAAQRAILESIQGRAIYISGARDDLFRRSFTLLKQLDQVKADKQLEAIPAVTKLRPGITEQPPVADEWAKIMQVLPKEIRESIYTAILSCPLDFLVVVRVISTALEQYKGLMWAPGRRARKLINEMVQNLRQEA